MNLFRRPWGFSEGFCLGAGLLAAGLLLQFLLGAVRWEALAWPLNICLVFVFTGLLAAAFLFRGKIYAVRWAMTGKAAVPAIVFVLSLTLLMGLIRQLPDSSRSPSAGGLRKMLSFWPFVLSYAWMLCILGLVSMHHFRNLAWKRLPFFLSHCGLFVALLSAAAGRADMQRLRMRVGEGQAERRAFDGKGELHELPFSIVLHDFRLEEYPPKLVVVDNHAGTVLPEGKPEWMELGHLPSHGCLSGWQIHVLESFDKARPVMEDDSLWYVEWPGDGAVTAACVLAVSADFRDSIAGWVGCGSHRFPLQALLLDSRHSLAMPVREKRRYLSEVVVCTPDGSEIPMEIEVNKPAAVGEWKIYQAGYDARKGRWSDVSVFEIVSDPWLPAVYAGIGLMFAGALGMFVAVQRCRKEVV